PAPAGPELTRVVGRIGKNHGHVLVVALADVTAGVEKTYAIAGSAGHAHAVTLGAEQMKALAGGAIVRTKSTKEFHQHKIWVRCSPAVDPPEWVTACEATFTGKDEHELVVPAADFEAKVARTYDVQGIADHAHSIS